jgi:hypothetical protein
MKKTFFTLLLCALNFFAFAQDDLVTVKDKSNLFSISAPSDWESSLDKYADNSVIELKAPKINESDERGPAFMMLSVGPYEKGVKTLKDVQRLLIGSLKGAKGVKVLENKMVGNKYVLVTTMTERGKTLKTKMVYWLEKGKMIASTYGAEVANYAKYLPKADAITSSLKLN